MGPNDAAQAAAHLVKVGGALAAIGLVLAGLFAFTQWPIKDCVAGIPNCSEALKVYDEAQIIMNLGVALVGGAVGAAVAWGLVQTGLVAPDALGIDNEQHD